MEKCKTCTNFKRVDPLSRFGTCIVVFDLVNLAPIDAAERMFIRKGMSFFPIPNPTLFIGEDFGCIHHKDK